MPTLVQCRDAIDTFVTNRWPTILARQETFLANRGRYWQGLVTHSNIPAWLSNQDGSAVGDRLTRSPSDQGAGTTWATVFPEWVSDLLPAQLCVDVYNGPQGHGWTLTVRVTHNGTLYLRVVNVGPESSRAKGWTAIVIPT
jgi:hypothetical protein